MVVTPIPSHGGIMAAPNKIPPTRQKGVFAASVAFSHTRRGHPHVFEWTLFWVQPFGFIQPFCVIASSSILTSEPPPLPSTPPTPPPPPE